MQELRDSLIDIWTEDVPRPFGKGYLTYERQLQAEIYHQLRNKFENKYIIWIEPVITSIEHKLNKVQPDIVITKNDHIEAIIEIKFCTWQNPVHEIDVKKLLLFDAASSKGVTLPFGYLPISHNWSIQEEAQNLSYRLTPEHLNVFIAVGLPNSDAFSVPLEKGLQNFLLLYGYIGNDNEHCFKVAS